MALCAGSSIVTHVAATGRAIATCDCGMARSGADRGEALTWLLAAHLEAQLRGFLPPEFILSVWPNRGESDGNVPFWDADTLARQFTCYGYTVADSVWR